MNLFNIQQEYIHLSQQLIESGGELTPELELALEINQQNLSVKAENYAHVIRTMDYECDIIDAEIKRLQGLKQGRVKAAERLKGMVSDAMQLTGTKELKFATVKLSFRKSESVEVENVNTLPAQFKKVEVSESAKKAEIKEALKKGEQIPGCQIVTKEHLQIK